MKFLNIVLMMLIWYAELFQIRMDSYFKPKFNLVEMYGNQKAIRWNTTTISGNLLLKKPLPKWSNIRVDEDIS